MIHQWGILVPKIIFTAIKTPNHIFIRNRRSSVLHARLNARKTIRRRIHKSIHDHNFISIFVLPRTWSLNARRQTMYSPKRRIFRSEPTRLCGNAPLYRLKYALFAYLPDIVPAQYHQRLRTRCFPQVITPWQWCFYRCRWRPPKYIKFS